MSATRFIVVRHCEAQGNIRRVFNGITDGDITENGARQLDLLAARMAGERFDVIYSSPLRRSFSMMLPVDFRRLSTWWMGLWS